MGELSCARLRCQRGSFTLQVDSLVIRAGEKVALLGENGCGKSTLLLILAGLLRARGEIDHDRQSWGGMTPQQRAEYAGFLPQEAGVLFNLSVRELTMLSLRQEKLLQGEPLQRIVDALELGELWERPYPSLSGGEKRRAMLARLLRREVELLFLDEPTAPLDMRHAAQFLRHATAIPGTVIAAMHDVNLAVRYFDRFILMKKGTILYDRKGDQLAAAELEETYGIGIDRCGDHFVPQR